MTRPSFAPRQPAPRGEVPGREPGAGRPRDRRWPGRQAHASSPPARDDEPSAPPPDRARQTAGRRLPGPAPRAQPRPGEAARPIFSVWWGADPCTSGDGDRPLGGRNKGWRQPAYKPGSVWRVTLRDGHSSGAPLARRLEQPTRAAAGIEPGTLGATPRTSRAAPIRSCSRWGLPCRLRCRRRGALLPHRFTLAVAGCPARAVSSLWHFPWGHPRRPLAATANPWSPDFPPPRAYGRKAGSRGSGRPAG